MADVSDASVLCLATDGSGRKDGRAGYGYSMRRMPPGTNVTAAAQQPGEELGYECGPVVTNPLDAEYIGATSGTNNTGELTAMHAALERANADVRPGESVLVLADSMLAICTTTGAWSTRRHKALVAANKKALAQLRNRGVSVRLAHVRAHRGHSMNERADALARFGAQKARVRDGRPVDRPLRRQPHPSHSPPPHTHHQQALRGVTVQAEVRRTATVPD